MNFNKLFGILAIILISSVITAGIAFAATVPATVDKVSVNGDKLSINSTNKLKVEIGDELEVKVEITATAEMENVQIEAEIKGYEHGESSDLTKVFDVEANTTYRKTLSIQIPDSADQDYYKLRITVTDRNNDAIVQNYNLKIEAPRHSMEIMDIMLIPSSDVEAGKALLASVRVKNTGDKDEDSVKVTASMPSLGISASTYIDEVESGDSETSEELYLRIPACAEPREYSLIVEVQYDDGHEEDSSSKMIRVNKGNSCSAENENAKEEKEEDEEDEAEEGFTADSSNSTSDNATNSNAGSESGRQEMLRKSLEISLIALIIALAVIGLIVGFAGFAKENKF